MKKTLFLLALLMSSLAFADSDDDDNNEMEIEVTVIRPLTVEVTDDIDFGKMVAGTSKSANGKFEVKGRSGEDYTAYIKELNGKKSGEILLVNDDDDKSTLAVNVSIDNPNSKIAKSGKNEHTVSANIAIPGDQAEGEYEKDITIALRYN